MPKASGGVRFFAPQFKARGAWGVRPGELNNSFKKKTILKEKARTYLSSSQITPPPISQTLTLLCCPYSAPSTSIWALLHQQPGTTLSVFALVLLLRHLLQSSSTFFFFFPGRASIGYLWSPSLPRFFSFFFFVMQFTHTQQAVSDWWSFARFFFSLSSFSCLLLPQSLVLCSLLWSLDLRMLLCFFQWTSLWLFIMGSGQRAVDFSSSLLIIFLKCNYACRLL